MWKISSFLLLLPVVSCRCPPTATEAYGQCYVATRMFATWPAAESICQNLGGHLASAANKEQNDFLWKLINDKMISNAWLGSNSINGVWSNSDGSPFSYTNFANPPKNNFAQTAATIGISTGKWTEQMVDYSIFYRFICQFPSCNSDNSLANSLLPKTNTSGLIYSEVSNSFYYTSAYEKVQISIAEGECNELGGHLPSVSNAIENEDLRAISEVFPNYGYDVTYSFGYYSDRRGVWHWTDGRSTGYTNWDPKANTAVSDSKSVFDPKKGLWLTSTDKPNLFMCQFSQETRNFC